MKIIKSLLIFLWNKFIDYKINIQNLICISKDKIYSKFKNKPNVKTIDETIDIIIKNKYSVSRFGDGELKLMNGKDIFFQKYSSDLEKNLKKVIRNELKNHIVCIPDVFDRLDKYSDEPRLYWKLHVAKTRQRWYSALNMNSEYYNSFISRCYYIFKDKNNSKHWFQKIRLIWENREVVIIEGAKSRLGIGNDLFYNTKSIERIICPEKDSYFKYEEILKEAKNINKSKLILLALGPTATVLAYDLSKLGYQAIDIGHLDIEYEWFLMGATKKEKIKNKFIGEVIGGSEVGELIDENYISEIIASIW